MWSIHKSNKDTYLLYKGWEVVGIGFTLEDLVQDTLEWMGRFNGTTLHVDLGE